MAEFHAQVVAAPNFLSYDNLANATLAVKYQYIKLKAARRLLHGGRAHAFKKNSGGLGFDSRQVLGFFLLFLSPSSVSLFRSLNEVQHYRFSLNQKTGMLG